MSDVAEMRKRGEEGYCPRGLGCSTSSICMCALAEDAINALEQAEARTLKAEAEWATCESAFRGLTSSHERETAARLKAEEALRKVDSICKKADTAEDDLDFAGALLAVSVVVRAALSEKGE